MTHVEDNGERRQFSTGAKRDTARGKGIFVGISPWAELRLAFRIEGGNEKYIDEGGWQNFKKGIPFTNMMDSVKRHTNAYLRGDTTEDHLAAILWNVQAIMEMEKLISLGVLPPEINDLPVYTSARDDVALGEDTAVFGQLKYTGPIYSGQISINGNPLDISDRPEFSHTLVFSDLHMGE